MKVINKFGEALIHGLLIFILLQLNGCGSAGLDSSHQKQETVNYSPVGMGDPGHSFINVSSQFFLNRPERVAIVWEVGFTPEYDAYLTSGLLMKGYRVAERKNLDKVLSEIKFQNSGLTQASAKKIANLLNVDTILFVNYYPINVPPYAGGGSMQIFACRFVSLVSAEILYASGDCGNDVFPPHDLSEDDVRVKENRFYGRAFEQNNMR